MRCNQVITEQQQDTEDYKITENDTIFIALSAFDDNTLFDTIRNFLIYAAYPQLLHFGVVHYSLKSARLPEDLKKNERIHYLNFIAPYAPGVGITRNLTYQLYNNQSFYLQTDAHMVAVRDWDEKLLLLHKHLEKRHNRFVISSYPPGFVIVDNKRMLVSDSG